MAAKKDTANFKSQLNGFNRSMVNVYIAGLKKRIHELENQMNDGGGIAVQPFEATENSAAYIAQLEQQVRDVQDQVTREKEISSLLEKECLRLQGEIEQMQMKGVTNTADTGEKTEVEQKKFFDRLLAKRLDVVCNEINRIRDDFTVDDDSLIIGKSNQSDDIFLPFPQNGNQQPYEQNAQNAQNAPIPPQTNAPPVQAAQAIEAAQPVSPEQNNYPNPAQVEPLAYPSSALPDAQNPYALNGEAHAQDYGSAGFVLQDQTSEYLGEGINSVPSLPKTSPYEYPSAYETNAAASFGSISEEDDEPDLSKLSDEDRKLLEEVQRIESGDATSQPYPASFAPPINDSDDYYNNNGSLFGASDYGGANSYNSDHSADIKPATEDNFGLGGMSGFGGGISYIPAPQQDSDDEDTDFSGLTVGEETKITADGTESGKPEDDLQRVQNKQNTQAADFADLSEFEIQPGETIDPFSQALANYDLLPGARGSEAAGQGAGMNISVTNIRPEALDGDLTMLGMNDFERSLLAKDTSQAAAISALNPTVVDTGADLTAITPNQVEKGEDLSEDTYELFGSLGGDTALKAFEGTKTDELHGNLAALGLFTGGDDDMSTSSDVTALFRRQ
jgi:hypothetical protein